MGTSLPRKVTTRARSQLRRGIDRVESRRKVPWPETIGEERHELAVATVNYNTVELTRQLLYSLHRSGAATQASTVVVVDNGSDDGSGQYLEALARRGLIVLLHNRWPPYHGPALNRAFSHLAASPGAPDIERVWILDSDAVVLRKDTTDVALAAARASNAAIVGELAPASARQSSAHVMLFSALVDPGRIWAAGMPVFHEHGLPFDAIQEETLRRGWHIEGFPYSAGEYVLHLGGATIASVVRDGRRGNAYFAAGVEDGAAEETCSYSFQGVANGPALYRTFLDDYDDVAGPLDPEAFAALLHDLRSADHGD